MTKIKFLLIHILFIAVSLSFVQCESAFWRNPDKTDWGVQVASTPEVRKIIDGYRGKVDFYYSSNPDSSIYYCHKLIAIYNREKIPSGTFNIYNQLTEIYLNRKGDALNAMKYHAEMLKLMKLKRWRETENSYFYIDMGNLQLVNNINREAIKNYHKAASLASKYKNNYAISLALNNLGIAFSKTGDYDSAYIYFNKSLTLRKKIMPLLAAQSEVYLARLFLDKNMPDSILFYRNRAFEDIKKQLFTAKALKPTGEAYARELHKTLEGDMVYLMAVYYEKTNKPDLAIENYRTTIQRAFKNRENLTIITGLFSIASLYDQKHSTSKVLHYADSCYRMSVDLHNHKFAVESAKLLSQVYSPSNLALSNFYMNKAMAYTDSIKEEELSEKNQNAKMMLISAQTDDSLRYYQVKQDKDDAVMSVQNLSIKILAVFIVILLGLVYIIYREQKLLKEEHLRQMNSILKSLEKEDENKLQHQAKPKSSLPNKFEEQFVDLIENEKVYTQKTLSLSELARQLDTNVNYLSQFINNHLKTNFNDYINEYRVKEACRIFKNDTIMKYTVDQVADMVGFSSRSTFYTTFKKFTGITPAFFQKNVSELNVQIAES
ncbi:MAG: AraC family transcriptional regulator [Paludibacter sp.]